MKWEYKIELKMSGYGGLMDRHEEAVYLNEMGKQEWECYQSLKSIFYFKRPLPITETPTNNAP